MSNQDTYGLDYLTQILRVNIDGMMALLFIIETGVKVNHHQMAMKTMYILRAPTWAI